MIQGHELRPGNIIEYFIGEDGIGWDKHIVDWQDIRSCAENNEHFNACHRPAPLTKDFLVDIVGFKPHENGHSYILFDEDGDEDDMFYFVLEYEGDEHSDIWYFEGLDNLPHIQIQHIHKLQNLFFYLREEELPIQKKK